MSATWSGRRSRAGWRTARSCKARSCGPRSTSSPGGSTGPYAIGVRASRRAGFLRLRPAAERAAVASAQEAQAEAIRAALAGGPRSVAELGGLASGFVGNVGLWVDLVRVPPSGTWERRRADRLALAETWVGPFECSEDDGLAHLVRAYLLAFGPATWRDIASWAGVALTDLKGTAGDRLDLVAYEDEAGQPLMDLPDAELPDPDTPAPVRFLPHWDALTLAHARRTGVLPEAHRAVIYTPRNPASVGTVLVDGRIVAGWRFRDGAVAVEPFEPIPARDLEAVEAERTALEAFSA